MSKALEELGQRVRAARIKKRWTVKGASASAGIARDTWKRVEDGLSVHDTKRAAVLDFLDLDDQGRPVGGGTQDADYVAAPGERVEPGAHDDEVLAELRAMREDINALSRRMARIESDPEPMGGPDGST